MWKADIWIFLLESFSDNRNNKQTKKLKHKEGKITNMFLSMFLA
jgi:hypothetical protein